jgi:hypothetical protein
MATSATQRADKPSRSALGLTSDSPWSRLASSPRADAKRLSAMTFKVAQSEDIISFGTPPRQQRR